MILIWLILVPLLGGLAAWVSGAGNSSRPRWIALAALFVDLVLILDLLVQYASLSTGSPWLVDFNRPWIPTLGISFHLAADGLGLLMVALTVVLGIVAVACSWTEIQERVGFFHLNLMVTLAGIIGVFLAMDLILFYFFWEVMLVPTYFLIGIWGHENRIYAAIKFFIFTQAGGLFMLFAILGLYFSHGTATGTYTFDYFQLLGTSMPLSTSMLLMLGFFVAFAVKLPAVPFHTWLPDAHTEAPTAGSVILAGLLLKTGAYGMLRFMLPLFPEAVESFTPAGMTIAVIGIIYGAILAFAQTDLKRLVAYTSISHLGFVMLGIFDRNQLGLQGALMQMVCHGLSTGALFVLVGALQERTGTRDMNRMGGLWSTAPRMGGIALILAIASLGLPGLGNFVGEILVLFGTYERSGFITVPAVLGLVLAAVYSLSMMQRTFFGENRRGWTLPDLSLRETVVLGTMITMLVWLGLYPQPVLNTARPTLEALTHYSATPKKKAEKQTSAEVSPRLLQRSATQPFKRGDTHWQSNVEHGPGEARTCLRRSVAPEKLAPNELAAADLGTRSAVNKIENRSPRLTANSYENRTVGPASCRSEVLMVHCGVFFHESWSEKVVQEVCPGNDRRQLQGVAANVRLAHGTRMSILDGPHKNTDL